MLYTSVPLERVYKDFSQPDNSNENVEYKEVILPHGRIVTKRDGDNYVIEKINSTQMSDYLSDEYIPGKSIQC